MRSSKNGRAKKGKLGALLGATALFLAIFLAVFYITDSFTMYWFLLSNRDGVSERRRSEDFEWYGEVGGTGQVDYPAIGNTGSNPNFNINADGAPGYAVKGEDLSLDALLEIFSLDEIATKEFACRIMVYKLDQEGYVENAVIGAIAYMMAEGTGMGTFTYESYYCSKNGPGEVSNCKVLDNQAWLDWMNGPGKERGYALYRSMGYNDRSCIGLGLPQYTDRWNLEGTKTVSNATAFIERANAAGVYWQDPMWQTDDVVEKLSYDSAWDLDQNPGPDPKSSTNITATEWCARVTYGIGYPNYSWVEQAAKNTKYYNDHVSCVPAATELYNKYSGKDELFYISDDSYLNPFSGPSYDNSTKPGLLIARMAVLIAGHDRTATGHKYNWTSGTSKDAYPDPFLQDKPGYKYYMKAHEAVLGDAILCSCDKASGTAILLSGVDPGFPHASSTEMSKHMSDSDIWEYKGMFNDVQLQPGDVIVWYGSSGGHIAIWTGPLVAGERFTGTTSTMYQASYYDYYCDVSTQTQPSSYWGKFKVFRCINPVYSSEGWDAFMQVLGDDYPEIQRPYSGGR